jgi:hypothetical protein
MRDSGRTFRMVSFDGFVFATVLLVRRLCFTLRDGFLLWIFFTLVFFSFVWFYIRLDAPLCGEWTSPGFWVMLELQLYP